MNDQTIPAVHPTLADMPQEEHRGCQWLQADISVEVDTIDDSEPLVISRIGKGGGSALILDHNGRSDWFLGKDVTPRPDLPRLEWPRNHADIDDVLHSADDPRIDALPAGSVLRDRDGDAVEKSDDGCWRGRGYEPTSGSGEKFGPWMVTRVGEDY